MVVHPSKMDPVKGFRPGSKVVAKAKWSRNRPLQQRRQWVIVTVKDDAVVLFPGGIRVYGYVTRRTNIKCGRRRSSSTSTVVIVGRHWPWSAIEVFAVIGSHRCCCQESHSYERPHHCHAKRQALSSLMRSARRGPGVVIFNTASPEGSVQWTCGGHRSKLAAGGTSGAPAASSAALWHCRHQSWSIGQILAIRLLRVGCGRQRHRFWV